MILISDKPINKKEDAEKALQNICDEIISSILTYDKDDPITIHINGPWGSGKSSCLNIIKREFDENRDGFYDKNGQLYLTACFNPWNVLDKSKLTGDFFKVLSDTFYRNKVKRTLSKGLKVSSAIASLLGKENLASQLCALGNYVDALNQNKPKNSLSESKEKICEMLRTSPFKRIIFIDEIDRLQSEEIATVFQLINNVCDLPNVIFVIAFDQEIVSTSLAEYLAKIKFEKTITGSLITDKKDGYINRSAKITDASFFPAESKVNLIETQKADIGDLYLQKIIQYRFDILVLGGNERISVLTKGLFQSNTFDKGEMTTISNEIRTLPLYGISSLNHPRQIKRFCPYLFNALKQYGEYIDSGDILMIEALRFFYPSSYTKFVGYLARVAKGDGLYQISTDIQRSFSWLSHRDSDSIVNYLVNENEKSLLKPYIRLFSKENAQLYLSNDGSGLITFSSIKKIIDSPIESKWLDSASNVNIRYALAQLYRFVKEEPIKFSSGDWLRWCVDNAFSLKVNGDKTRYSPVLFGELLGCLLSLLDEENAKNVLDTIVGLCKTQRIGEELASFLDGIIRHTDNDKRQFVSEVLAGNFADEIIDAIVSYSKSLNESPSGFNNMLNVLNQFGKLSNLFKIYDSFNEDEKVNFMCNSYGLYSSKRDELNFSPPIMGVFGFRDNAGNELNSIRETSFYKAKISKVLSMSKVNLSTLYCYLWPNLYSFQNDGFGGESVEAKISELVNNKKLVVNDDIQGI